MRASVSILLPISWLFHCSSTSLLLSVVPISCLFRLGTWGASPPDSIMPLLSWGWIADGEASGGRTADDVAAGVCWGRS
jgi:hypothetical protein